MKMFNIHGHMGTTSSGEPISPIELINDMDKFGIEKTGISSLSGTDNRKQNDLVYCAHQQFPDRILPYAFINPKSPNVHDEIDLCFGERRYVGAKFHPWKHGYFADNTPQLEEVLAHIEQYGVHVQVFPGMSPLCTPYVWIRYAQKYPKIRFVFTHMGCREFGYSVIEAVKDVSNIYLETSVIYETDVLLNAKKCVGADRIVFGTDWPYKSTRCEIEKIYLMGFTDDEIEKVFWKNTEQLWKIAK